VSIGARLHRLERQHAPGWPGYPAPVFSDAHLAEVAVIVAEVLGVEATLAHIAERTGEPLPVNLERFIRGRRGREHVAAAPPRDQPRG